MTGIVPTVRRPGGSSSSSSITPRSRDGVRDCRRPRIFGRGGVGAGAIALFGGADDDGDGRSGGTIEDGGIGVPADVAVATEDDLVPAAPVREVRGAA